MALSVVDAHVRERLMWLRQQQEDMTILLSQVSTACLHCEKTLQQVRDELGSGLIYPCQADTDSCSLFPVVGRLQSRAGEAGDQLSAGDAPEAAAPVHGAGRPHPAGRRHPRHLHEGTQRFPAVHSCSSTLSLKLKELMVCLCFTLSGQPGPHRSKDGDPGRDSRSGRSRKNHHPLQAETRRVHAAHPDHR